MQPELQEISARAQGRRASFNPSVHGARGLFAMLVFCFHVANSGLPTFYGEDHWLATWVFQSFKFGVELFFGISGFVILGALARAPSIRAFMWDRATRIYPLLWLTLIAITAVAFATGRWMPPFGDWLLNFLAPPPFYNLPQVNPAAWSLGYEISFYAICAACWYAATRGWRWMPIAVIVGAVLIALLPRAILMLAGLMAAAGWVGRTPLRRLASLAPAVWLAAFLLLWRWLEFRSPMHDIARLNPVDVSIADWIPLAPAILLAGLLGALALDGIIAQEGAMTRLLRTPLFRWLGTISYSFYLWHPVVMATTKSVMNATDAAGRLGEWSQIGFAVLSLPPALLVAHFSQRVIEVRLTRALRRHGPREDRGNAPITAALDEAPAATMSRAKS